MPQYKVVPMKRTRTIGPKLDAAGAQLFDAKQNPLFETETEIVGYQIVELQQAGIYHKYKDLQGAELLIPVRTFGSMYATAEQAQAHIDTPVAWDDLGKPEQTE